MVYNTNKTVNTQGKAKQDILYKNKHDPGGWISRERCSWSTEGRDGWLWDFILRKDWKPPSCLLFQ